MRFADRDNRDEHCENFGEQIIVPLPSFSRLGLSASGGKLNNGRYRATEVSLGRLRCRDESVRIDSRLPLGDLGASAVVDQFARSLGREFDIGIGSRRFDQVGCPGGISGVVLANGAAAYFAQSDDSCQSTSRRIPGRCGIAESCVFTDDRLARVCFLGIRVGDLVALEKRFFGAGIGIGRDHILGDRSRSACR